MQAMLITSVHIDIEAEKNAFDNGQEEKENNCFSKNNVIQ